MPVSCFVKLGWGPGLENLTGEAERFRSRHHLNECDLGSDGQLVLKADVELADAAQLVKDFYREVLRSDDIATPASLIASYRVGNVSHRVVNVWAPWSLVVTTNRTWEGSFPRCIAIDELVLWHLGDAVPLVYSEEAGLCIWKDPVPVDPDSSPPDEKHADTGPLFAPEGEPPDFIEVEEL